MNTNTSPSHPLDLTGQVRINNFVPVFSGNYSSVHTGHITGSHAQVAIKIIRPVGDHDSVRRKLRREILVWSTAHHANIYPFNGYANDEAFGPFGALVSPWCHKGDASKFLNDHGERMIIAERVNLWKGVIDGVAYLHRCNPPIVHGDLKPGNVLIDEDGTPRICDFGLARIFFDQSGTGTTTTSEHTGTVRYLAPELVTEANVPPTFESDVYALGSLGLEFIYLQKPYANHVNNLRGHIYQDLRRGFPPAMTRPELEWPSGRLWPLLVHCWTADPTSRPLAMTIGRKLRHTILSFPATVLEKIISMSIESCQEDDEGWKEICGHFHSLCLVSRSCYRLALPALYADLRLGRDINPSRIPSLLHALESSKKETHLSRYGPNGYGTFTHTLVLCFTNEIELVSWAQAIIPLTPNLRYSHVSIGTSYWTSKRKLPLTNVDFENISASFFRNYVPSLLEMTEAQHVCIRDFDGYSHLRSTEIQPPSPSTSSKAVLLNIHKIELDGMSTGKLAFLLPIMSNWVLPQLSSLDLWNIEMNSADEECLYDFLRCHGNRLQTIRITPMWSRIQVSTVLQLCINLYSIRFDQLHSSFDFSTLSHPHLKLEKIVFEAYGIDMEEVITTLCRLKSVAREVFPNLVDAIVIYWETEERIASFGADESFITVHKSYFARSSYKIYDDGRRSPPPNPLSETDDEMSDEY